MLPLPLVLRALPVALLAGPGGAAEPDSAAAVSPRWVFAAEDTLELPAPFHMSEVEIRATRLEIGDIVDRCIESEERLRENIESHVYTQSVRTVFHVDGYGENAKKRMVIEQADRVFFRKPDDSRTVNITTARYVIEDGERRPWEDGEDETVDIEYDDLNGLPFYLEDREQYRFEIVSRRIVGDRVIYEVDLEPRSDFEIAPGGRIWIDTSTFSILREEFDFGDRVPMPMFVKSVGPFIRERERIGDLWVWKRFLVRVDLRMGWLRFLEKDIPDTVEFIVSFRDHRVNEDPAPDESRPAASR